MVDPDWRRTRRHDVAVEASAGPGTMWRRGAVSGGEGSGTIPTRSISDPPRRDKGGRRSSAATGVECRGGTRRIFYCGLVPEEPPRGVALP